MKTTLPFLVCFLSIATAFGQKPAPQQPLTQYTNPEVHDVYKPKYDQKKWKKRPKNIILIIGDGTGLAQWYSAYTANRGALTVFQISDIGFSITQSGSSYITDSAAGATAIASGSKTRNRYVGVDTSKVRLPLITEQLRTKGYLLAVISNGDITDATPASFYAHQPDRGMSEEIALDFMTSRTDILVGGRPEVFTHRKDGRNLMDELKRSGYATSTNFSAIDSIRSHRFVVLDSKAVVSKMAGRGDFLQRSLTASLRALSSQKKPFFIMEEGAQIDWGGHDNNIEYVVREALDLDRSIAEALKFADANGETLVVVTADHETGGLSLIGGNVAGGSVTASFGTGQHTAIAVPVFAYGPGSELFRGVYQNTEIYYKLAELLGL